MNPPRVRRFLLLLALLSGITQDTQAAVPTAIPQRFLQEVATTYRLPSGSESIAPQLLDKASDASIRVLSQGRWYTFKQDQWSASTNIPQSTDTHTWIWDANDKAIQIEIAGATLRQILRGTDGIWLLTRDGLYLYANKKLTTVSVPGSQGNILHQGALDKQGILHLASSAGLFRRENREWRRIEASDSLGRSWGTHDVLGITFDPRDRLWFATKAGVAHRDAEGWRFLEAKDGLPYNAFTGLASDSRGRIWMGTELGLIRYQAPEWHYRQGPLWLPDDHVHQIATDASDAAWIITGKGLARISWIEMTLQAKAERYEEEIARYIKRTPWGYTAEGQLRKPNDRSSAAPEDSDNDGLWTSMYGAGECFAYGATRNPQAKERARQAFEALRFLQKVTQGGPHSPPKGFVARTVRSVELPDPNEGLEAQDRAAVAHDAAWKIYQPRWPKSADGKWYWKSDTSSDELDGHYFFYSVYFDLCADTDAEKGRVREVVKDLTDHLLSHDFNLIDHDGKPTRWGVFSPRSLNQDPQWWPERGLNSLSILSYLAVAAHVTGDPVYENALNELVERHGYAHNLMFSKLQRGPGSGNQSDDEMAFMSYYNLLRHTRNDTLKKMGLYSFFEYWTNEMPEMNPFFNFCYAAHALGKSTQNPFGTYSVEPWNGWLEDSQATLYGFPLDRLKWSHKNSHRLDIVFLDAHRSKDLYSKDRRERGHRVGGKVLPVENRHFSHWNTDPWALDYVGHGEELASGAVYLLPYYMGLYHGFVEKP